MADRFQNTIPGMSSPCSRAFDVSPNDGSDMALTTRALWVGVYGNVKVTTAEGDTVIFVGVQGLLPVRAARVWANGTTATNIVGMH